MARSWVVGAVALAALMPVQWLAAQAPAPAQDQANDEVTLYNKGHFKGVHTTVLGPTRFPSPFMMKSVAIPAGKQWEFCSGNTYTGCRQFSQSVPSTVMNVRSARPVAGIIPASATEAQGLRGTGQSLRGLASEFFVAPEQGGNRVEVQPGSAEAMSRQAIEFCRTHGWSGSAHQRLQTVGGHFYLADVLCADE
ncbi:MAG: hypothetical protein ABIO69_08755 [Sphingomicrobium sp.]